MGHLGVPETQKEDSVLLGSSVREIPQDEISETLSLEQPHSAEKSKAVDFHSAQVPSHELLGSLPFASHVRTKWMKECPEKLARSCAPNVVLES